MQPGSDYLDNAKNIISDMLMAANIMGYVHSFDEQEAQSDSSNFAYVLDHVTILNVLEKAGLGDEYISELRMKTGEKVDVIAKLDFYSRMDALKSVLAKNIETGMGFRDFLAKVGENKILRDLGLSSRSPWYLETVYRTNYSSAYNAGRYDAAMKSKSVQYLEYNAVVDDRTTDICDALNGSVWEKTDPRWDTYMPPNHFKCRSFVIEVTRARARALNIEPSGDPRLTDDNGDAIIHSEGFRDNQAKRNGWMKPTKDMRDRLENYEKENKI